MAGRGQRLVERSDVYLGPAVVIGGYNIDGEGDREERQEQVGMHGGLSC